MILIFVRAPKANMLDFMLNMNNIEKSISNSMVSKICGKDVNIQPVGKPNYRARQQRSRILGM